MLNSALIKKYGTLATILLALNSSPAFAQGKPLPFLSLLLGPDAPVLKQQMDLGAFEENTQIIGTLEVTERNAIGDCDIYSATTDEYKTNMPLINTGFVSNYTQLSIPDNTGYNLTPDTYKANCTFKNGTKTSIEENAATFEVTPTTPPPFETSFEVIGDGKVDITCDEHGLEEFFQGTTNYSDKYTPGENLTNCTYNPIGITEYFSNATLNGEPLEQNTSFSIKEENQAYQFNFIPL